VKNSVELKYWFCPESGVLRKVEYHGHYMTFGGKVDEQIVFELKERRTKERVLDWVKSGETGQAALHAMLTSDASVDETVVSQALSAADPLTQSLALALSYRRDLSVKDATQIEQLSHSPDPQVARIAKRILSRTPLQTATTKFRAFDPGTTLRYMTSKNYEGYPYILHVPPDYRGDKPFPLIVILTGGPGIAMDGANGSEPAIANTGYLIVYPHAAGKMWWEPESTKMFDALLQELSTLLNIKATFITGFSNGGTGAVYYASKWPTRFRAMVSLMGAGPCLTDLGTLHFDELAAMPTLIVHGTKDPIIPYDCSERLYRALRKKHSAELSIELLKDRGHDITVGTDDGMTLTFFDKISGTQ
jgi:dipeptidyl aminopeptidase/acylaminoacyl peptidase